MKRRPPKSRTGYCPVCGRRLTTTAHDEGKPKGRHRTRLQGKMAAATE
nr:hypothetical protein [Exiguobacterium sp. UBA5002]